MNENLQTKYYEIIEKNHHLFKGFEKKRIRRFWISVLKYGIPCSIAFAGCIWLLLNTSINYKSFSDIVSLTLTPPFLFCALMHGANRSFTKEYKNLCLPQILNIFNAKLIKNYDWKFVTNEIPRSKLFSIFNEHDVDDCIEVNYKDCKFNILELELNNRTRCGKRNSVHTCFKGVIITIPYNKKVEYDTIITTKNDYNILNQKGEFQYERFYAPFMALFFGIAYFVIKEPVRYIFLAISILAFISSIIYLLYHAKIAPKNKIKLEDPLFEKKFDVYSDNEIEARYHVTTGFMERFLNLKTAFGCKKAKCAFYDDKIMIAISTNKNLFEIGNLFKSCTNVKNKKDFFYEILSIIDLIDYFKLNKNTKL